MYWPAVALVTLLAIFLAACGGNGTGTETASSAGFSVSLTNCQLDQADGAIENHSDQARRITVQVLLEDAPGTHFGVAETDWMQLEPGGRSDWHVTMSLSRDADRATRCRARVWDGATYLLDVSAPRSDDVSEPRSNDESTTEAIFCAPKPSATRSGTFTPPQVGYWEFDGECKNGYTAEPESPAQRNAENPGAAIDAPSGTTDPLDQEPSAGMLTVTPAELGKLRVALEDAMLTAAEVPLDNAEEYPGRFVRTQSVLDLLAEVQASFSAVAYELTGVDASLEPLLLAQDLESFLDDLETAHGVGYALGYSRAFSDPVSRQALLLGIEVFPTPNGAERYWRGQGALLDPALIADDPVQRLLIESAVGGLTGSDLGHSCGGIFNFDFDFPLDDRSLVDGDSCSLELLYDPDSAATPSDVLSEEGGRALIGPAVRGSIEFGSLLLANVIIRGIYIGTSSANIQATLDGIPLLTQPFSVLASRLIERGIVGIDLGNAAPGPSSTGGTAAGDLGLFGLPVPMTQALPNCGYNDPCAGPPAKQHHTGEDFPGREAVASADGVVFRIELNDVGCAGPRTGQCHDHGLGNTVILQHELPGDGVVYSQYSHLASVDSEIREGTCVRRGDSIGLIGGSGYGLIDHWPVHLHFEIKDTPVIGAPDFTDNWGYTTNHPDDYGYRDPEEFIGAVRTTLCVG